jgi:hypothetical protein
MSVSAMLGWACAHGRRIVVQGISSRTRRASDCPPAALREADCAETFQQSKRAILQMVNFDFLMSPHCNID